MKLKDRLLIGASVICATLAGPINIQADSVWNLPPKKTILKELQEIHTKEEFEKYYSFSRNHRKNMGILSKLSAEEFRNIVEETSFDWLKELTGRIDCKRYAHGHERVELLRGLVGKINSHVKNRTELGGYVSAWQVLVTIGIENGGKNEINCENGGGVMHLLYLYNKDINILNIDQSLFRGVEQLNRLNKMFNNNEKTTALGYNIGESRVEKIKNQISDHLEYKDVENSKPTYYQIMWLLKRKNSAVALNGERHVDIYLEFSNKIKKEGLFEYNLETNTVKYIGPEKGLDLESPKPSYKKGLDLEPPKPSYKLRKINF